MGGHSASLSSSFQSPTDVHPSFICWSVSFYPQAIQNHRRKSVTGLSVDFLSINVFGFAFYTIYCALLLFSPAIRAQYAVRHPHAPEPTVRYNDLAFGLHALAISTYTWTQLFFHGFERAASQRLSKLMGAVMVGCFTGIGLVALLASTGVRGWEALDVVYAFSYAKLFITVIKYTPQALLNFRRKSTVGWSIHNILLDASGGLLSLAQLFIDSSLNSDWSGVTGNPIKFGLGSISLVYDALFCVQHFVLYRGAEEAYEGEEVESDEETRVASTGYGSFDSEEGSSGQGPRKVRRKDEREEVERALLDRTPSF